MKSYFLILSAIFFVNFSAFAEEELISRDPAEISIQDLICTNSNRESYGRKFCRKFKNEAVSYLKARAKHFIGNYYEGKLLEMDYRPENKSFCLVKNPKTDQAVEIVTPICNISDQKKAEIDKNWLGESCGRKTDVPTITDRCFDSVSKNFVAKNQSGDLSLALSTPIDDSLCSECGTSLDEKDRCKFALDSLKEEQLFILKLKSSGQISSDDQKQIDEKLISLNDKSKLNDELKDDWKEYLEANPDGFCPANNLVDLRKCKREMSYFRGVHSQVKQNILEKLIEEIQSGSIKLHLADDNDPNSERPCGAYGLALINSYERKGGVKETHANLEGLYRPTEKILDTNDLEGCLGAENGSESDSFKNSIKNAHVVDEKGFKRQKKRASHSFCKMVYARKEMESLLHKLTTCELNMRTKKEYYSFQVNIDRELNGIINGVVNPCLSKAKKSKSLTCRRGCVTKKYYSCYKSEVVSYLKSRFERLYPVKEGLGEPGFPKLGSDQNRGLASESKNSSDIPPLCGLMLIPLFRRKKKTGHKPYNKKSLKNVILIFIALIALSLGSACNDDGDISFDTAGIPEPDADINGPSSGGQPLGQTIDDATRDAATFHSGENSSIISINTGGSDKKSETGQSNATAAEKTSDKALANNDLNKKVGQGIAPTVNVGGDASKSATSSNSSSSDSNAEGSTTQKGPTSVSSKSEFESGENRLGGGSRGTTGDVAARTPGSEFANSGKNDKNQPSGSNNSDSAQGNTGPMSDKDYFELIERKGVSLFEIVSRRYENFSYELENPKKK